MKKIIIIVFLFSLINVNAQQTKVLFIGNSYTYVNDLPQLLKDLALSYGDTILTAQSTPGGYQLNQHASDATTLNKINAQDWDFVIIQEQSQKPSFPPTQVQSNVYPYAKALNDSIKANYSCTETVFYMTWGRKNGDASNCASYTPLCTYNGMQQRLKESYMEMADSNLATVAPVGVVWKNVRDSFPSIELYNPDESHPSLHGSYLAACVFYSTLFQKSTIGSTFMPIGIGTGDAVTLQTVATNTVLDSLDLWRINANHPVAGFNYTGGGTINFTNTSTNDVYYHWDFDDGNTSTLENPTNAYNNSGNYDVELVVFSVDSCFSDTITQNIVVNGVGIEGVKNNQDIKIYPNPTSDVVNIISDKKFNTIHVRDIVGRLILEQSATKIDLSNYPNGVYILETFDESKSIEKFKVIKE